MLTSQPTFTGNHDMGRIGYFLVQDNPGAVDAELLARSKLAQALHVFCPRDARHLLRR